MDKPDQGGAMERHHQEMHAMRMRMLWVHFLVIALGAWLLTSPFQFGLFEGGGSTVRDVTAERNLWSPALRNLLTGWSDIAGGLALMVTGALSLHPRFKWAQWATTAVGLWLLAAPILLWTPSPAAYANDTIVGALAITFSILVPMMPGMSHQGMMDRNPVPPGWTYSPSSWLQRVPLIALGLFGFLVARYLAAYQLGHVGSVWDPFFSGEGGLNGTEDIITSDVSKAFPISDAGLGAYAYMIEALMGSMGAATRWRTMPWMVTFFFILVVPLGAVSIGFIVIQPIMIGTYCTLCLIQAFAMLAMIPLAVDEVVATGQYLRRRMARGDRFWPLFLKGGPDEGDAADHAADFGAPLPRQVRSAVLGVTLPWSLVASTVLGMWMMFTPLTFGTEGAVANSDHLVGAMVVTVSVIALAEVVRLLRVLNIAFGAWLMAAPFVVGTGLDGAAAFNDLIVGLLVIVLAAPRGRRSAQHYGGWDRWVA